MRGSLIAVALLVAGCQTPRSDVAPPLGDTASITPAPTAAPVAACRNDSAGIVVTTDRGIGGTGDKADSIADRGIGGTGIDGIGGTGVDGIGGTGIGTGRAVLALRGHNAGERGDSGAGVVGTVTGFHSLCLNGLDVGLEGISRINEDGTPLQSARLLLGQVAAIDTRGNGAAMHAVGIGIRHEVSGPITALPRPGLEIEVAGQRVVLGDHLFMSNDVARETLRIGDWLSVSGLRDIAGDIHATRLDRRDPGSVLVAGRPELHGGQWLLGTLRLHVTGKPPVPGQRVLLAGRIQAGVLEVERIAEDSLVSGGHGARHLIVEGYVQASGTDVRLGQGLRAAIGPRFGAPPPAGQPAIVDLVADSANNMVAVSWRTGSAPGTSAGE